MSFFLISQIITYVNGCEQSRFGHPIYVHHSQMMVKAAVMHDAKAILKQVTCLKQRACIAANAADGGAYA